FTSALFKVLLTLKLLHGSRTGAKGSTLEDIAMHMIKHFCLDGDIKSQVLASLKFGVKMHFIQKKKDKFSLILPASSIHLAPCKFKNEETERIQCIFPSAWYSNACNNICAASDQSSCCGKRKRTMPNVCCQDQDQSDDDNPCDICKKKSKHSQPTCSETSACLQADEPSPKSCSKCYPPPKKPKRKPCAPPCPKPRPPICARKRKRGRRSNKSVYDDYCQLCPQMEEDDDDDVLYMMAPYPSYKKRVKFAKSRSPIPDKKSLNSAESYANIVIYYLSKLKNLFQSSSDRDKDTSKYLHGDRYDLSSRSILKKTCGRSAYANSDLEGKQKAYEIVNAALQYGCANDVIEKVGNYFLVKKESEHNIATRRPTPGPDYIRCANCKNLTKFSNKHGNISDNKEKGKISSKQRRRNTYYEDDYGHTTSSRRKQSPSNTSIVNYCSKCYARMKSNRR
ncbi:hypothetical protein BDFB_005701, partial [Asbolus verrucosus]